MLLLGNNMHKINKFAFVWYDNLYYLCTRKKTKI